MLPKFGLGTFQLKDKSQLHAILDTALRAGVRLIDTAQCYRNEHYISEILSELLPKHNLTREDVFIVSKIDTKNQGYEKCMESSRESIELFSYIDVMLIHWPGVQGIKSQDPKIKQIRSETWCALESLHLEQSIRMIGVSNYNKHHLLELLDHCSVKPHVLQNEYHPRYQQKDIVSLCKQHGIIFMGYSPLGQGDLLTDSIVSSISEETGLTPAQVLLKWGMQKGAIVIPRSVRTKRVEENVRSWVDGVELSKGDLERLDGLEDGHKYCWDPEPVV